MMALARLTGEMERLKARHRHRTLKLPGGIDFTSNDYLGLARHPALRQAVMDALDREGVVGSTASRSLRGHHPSHDELEAFAAKYLGCGKALYLSTGFLANYALFTTLPDRHDAVVVDERVHASVKDGIHAGTARRFKVAHNDAQAFEDAVVRARRLGAKQVWIAVEAVYSMDGDIAPVADLLAIAEHHDTMLIVDEAHATGIFGPSGRGLCEGHHGDRVITLHTCGKALGVAGGLIGGPKAVVDYLINAARPFIYSTAPPPSIAAAVTRSLQLVAEEPWRRERLKALASRAYDALSATVDARVPRSGTQILPVILGSEARALAVAAVLQEAGYDVRAIRPPTVEAGTSRLRVSLSVDRSEDEIDGLAATLAEAVRRHAA